MGGFDMVLHVGWRLGASDLQDLWPVKRGRGGRDLWTVCQMNETQAAVRWVVPSHVHRLLRRPKCIVKVVLAAGPNPHCPLVSSCSTKDLAPMRHVMVMVMMMMMMTAPSAHTSSTVESPPPPHFWQDPLVAAVVIAGVLCGILLFMVLLSWWVCVCAGTHVCRVCGCVCVLWGASTVSWRVGGAVL